MKFIIAGLPQQLYGVGLLDYESCRAAGIPCGDRHEVRLRGSDSRLQTWPPPPSWPWTPTCWTIAMQPTSLLLRTQLLLLLHVGRKTATKHHHNELELLWWTTVVSRLLHFLEILTFAAQAYWKGNLEYLWVRSLRVSASSRIWNLHCGWNGSKKVSILFSCFFQQYIWVWRENSGVL